MSDATTNEKILEVGAKRLWEMEVEANPPVVPVSWELIGPSWAGEVYRERVNAILQDVVPLIESRARRKLRQELLREINRPTSMSRTVMGAVKVTWLRRWCAAPDSHEIPKGY